MSIHYPQPPCLIAPERRAEIPLYPTRPYVAPTPDHAHGDRHHAPSPAPNLEKAA